MPKPMPCRTPNVIGNWLVSDMKIVVKEPNENITAPNRPPNLNEYLFDIKLRTIPENENN